MKARRRGKFDAQLPSATELKAGLLNDRATVLEDPAKVQRMGLKLGNESPGHVRHSPLLSRKFCAGGAGSLDKEREVINDQGAQGSLIRY